MKDEFMKILMENNPEKMKTYLLKFGKKPKPICPFYIIKSNIKEEEKDVNGKQ